MHIRIFFNDYYSESLSKVISIGTAVPEYKHNQMDILQFMQESYGMDDGGKRKIRYLYKQAGIDHRYSVVPDYSIGIKDWQFYPKSETLEPFPSLEKRMELYTRLSPGPYRNYTHYWKGKPIDAE